MSADHEPHRELFVYYRVADADASIAGDALQRMQRRLAESHPGLAARVLRRPGSSGGVQTWMETYAMLDGGVDAALESAIESAALALADWTIGERHVEIFVDASPPAA